MKIKHSKKNTEYGTGIEINLSADEVAMAIDAWVTSQNVEISGSRTVTVNGSSCKNARIFVDPSGYVVHNGIKISGTGGDLVAHINGIIMRQEWPYYFIEIEKDYGPSFTTNPDTATKVSIHDLDEVMKSIIRYSNIKSITGLKWILVD